jgi:hypothetical protein
LSACQPHLAHAETEMPTEGRQLKLVIRPMA